MISTLISLLRNVAVIDSGKGIPTIDAEKILKLSSIPKLPGVIERNTEKAVTVPIKIDFTNPIFKPNK